MTRARLLSGRSLRAGTRRLASVGAVAAAVAAPGACGQFFGPDDVVPPALQGMDVTLALGDRYLTVDAFPIDRQFRLRFGQRLPIEVRVSSGDREHADLYRRYCPSRGGYGVYDCFSFDVSLRDGADLDALARLAEANGGRLARLGVCSTSGCWYSSHFARVVLFSPDDLIDTARRARDWPGVEIVELAYIGGCGFGGCPPTPFQNLTVRVPTDTGRAAVGDGIVQVRSGDTLAVTYRQPSGETLTVWHPVP